MRRGFKTWLALAALAGVIQFRPVGAAAEASAVGPTLHLDYGTAKSSGNPLAEFMYFVPLIAPEPVAITKSAGNTQTARVLTSSRHFTDKAFTVTCEFEFDGVGYQRNVLDHAVTIRAHEKELKAGGIVAQQLDSINIEGGGFVSIQADGTVLNKVPTVNTVRLVFNGRGKESPVSIDLSDLAYQGGAVVPQNQMVARVNTLTFRRQPGVPKMEITVASVKRKEAGNGMWQNFVGRVKGTAVNLFIKPVVVQPGGNQAMLDFGLAIATQAPTYTFPFAKGLKQ
jgi:hypothetical protein